MPVFVAFNTLYNECKKFFVEKSFVEKRIFCRKYYITFCGQISNFGVKYKIFGSNIRFWGQISDFGVKYQIWGQISDFGVKYQILGSNIKFWGQI